MISSPRRAGARVAAGLVLLVLAASPVAAVDPGVTWTGQIPVGQIQTGAQREALASTSVRGRVYLHAVTLTLGGTTGGSANVQYRKSADLGASWPVSVRLTSTGWADFPSVAAAGMMVVVAWRSGSAGGRPDEIKLRVSTNNGSTWGPVRRLPAPRLPGVPSVAVAGTTIHVAWTDATGSARWARVARSLDRGVTWTLRGLDATPTTGDTLVAASGLAVFTAWARRDSQAIVGRLSPDGGRTWPAPEVLATSTMAWAGIAIAARPDRVAIAWAGLGQPEVTAPELHVRVRAAGTWGPTASLAAAPPGAEYDSYGTFRMPAIRLLSTSRVGVAFAACYPYATAETPWDPCGAGAAGTSDDVLWAESTDNGRSWTPPTVVSPLGTKYGGWGFPNVGSVSAVWTSRDLRGVLADRLSGETDWNSRVFFTRGHGLP